VNSPSETKRFANGRQKLNRQRFQTIPSCDLINLTSLIGSIYVKKVSESGDYSAFARPGENTAKVRDNFSRRYA